MSTDQPSVRQQGFWDAIRTDFPSSVVVFLVALPLCMGIAIASGAPVAAGLITGIVGGLVVGFLAGSPLQVSGPAAGLTVIVYDVVQTFGLEMLGLVVLMAGLFQVAAGLLRWGQWFRAVSPAVIKGMLAGIGFLILASQFHVMIDDQPRGSGAENLATIPSAIVKSLEWPETRPREERRARIEALREVGELHRRQVSLHERVTEYLPYQDPLGKKPGSADEANPAVLGSAVAAEVPDEVRESLAAQQQAIAARLGEVVDQLRAGPPMADGQTMEKKVAAAAEAALQQNRETVEALRQAPPEALLASQTAAVQSLEDLLKALKSHPLAAFAGLFTILVILLWQGFAPKSLRVLPAPLVAVVLAAALATVLALPVLYVEVPDNLWDEVRLPVLSSPTDIPWLGLVQAALLMAVVASAETLLCATAVDQLQNGPRTRYDRELFAQGVGNTICGCLGALPMTGVIVRSSANVHAGAKTRLSAILHGVWLLLFVTFLGFALRLIPTAALAAMLVYTGYKLIDPKAIASLRRFGWGEVVVYTATVGMIVFTDLLTGVLVGVALSAIKLLYTFSHLSTRLSVQKETGQATLHLVGSATFLRLPQLAAQLEQVPRGAELQVDFKRLAYIDHACLELLINWGKQHEASGGSLNLNWDSLHARFHGAEETDSVRATPATAPHRASTTEVLQH